MKRLEIVWQRLLVGAETCERCGDTGVSVVRAAEALRAELAPLDIEVVLTQKALLPASPGVLQESNRVFMNGASVEDLLGATVGASHCQSCCDLLGGNVDCRTIVVDGRSYDALPVELLVRAGRAAAALLA